jgi:hypothetical protein
MIDRRILITCSLLTFKYPEISNVHIIDWPATPYFSLVAKKKKKEEKENLKKERKENR